MREDYLWDKTGHDPEIEKLENALSEFRYKEIAPPKVVPANISAVEKISSRSFFSFSFGFAFAFCAALILILLGVWFQVSNNSEGENDLAKENTPEIKTVSPAKSSEIFEPTEKFEPIEEVKSLPEKEQPKFTKKMKTASPSPKENFPKRKFTKRSEKSSEIETVKLTEEERYAYDQLMLALSITSSKLKLVKNKIDGIEKSDAVLKNDDTRRN